jgi:DNA-directed RNA polymerase beta' subunit
MVVRQTPETVISSLSGCYFSFYQEEEIRKLSVLRVFNPITFDSNNTPMPHGLYDTRMGPIKIEEYCATCQKAYDICPGHFGHIELPIPVYNPIKFNSLLKLLRRVCLYCFHFKAPVAETLRAKQNLSYHQTMTTSSSINATQHKLNELISKMISQKCTNCKTLSPSFKTDKTTKVFIQSSNHNFKSIFKENSFCAPRKHKKVDFKSHAFERYPRINKEVEATQIGVCKSESFRCLTIYEIIYIVRLFWENEWEIVTIIYKNNNMIQNQITTG